jgi:probable HAF family extracellular repeat protein
MVDLGPVDGGEDLAVNDLGQVAGNHWVGEDQLRAFVWRSGQRRDLRVGRDQDRAHDINNAGQIVGDSSRGAFLWRGGKTRMLKGVQWAYGINERGQVVGGAVDRQGRRRALLWWRGRVTDLGGGSALALNESGEVLCEGVYGPFLWRDGRRISIGSVGEFGGVVALNNSGQVIGEVDDAAGRHAFIWERGRRQMILPAYETSVAAINNHGFIVGLRAKTMSSQSEAFVWRDGRATPLPGLGGTSVVPVAVNDREQIIGTATTTGDRISHAVLWTKTG